MEVWDLYDEYRNPTNQTMISGQRVPEGLYRLAVSICLFNEQGHMLIQQRVNNREPWPNLWDFTAAGSVIKGETSSHGAVRELYEELGITLSSKFNRPAITITFEGGFDDYYIEEVDSNLLTYTLQKSEVQAIKWATKEEILEMISSNEFIPYQDSFVNLIFDVYKQSGVYRKEY